MSSVFTLGLGLLLGMRHATEPDHLVTVATIASCEHRKAVALRIGALWGLGHSATVFVVGGALAYTGYKVHFKTALALEMLVALMLIVLGTLNMRESIRRPTIQSKIEHQKLSKTRTFRSFFAGIIHGLAGSSAIALLLVPIVPSSMFTILYLMLFGLGTILGMTLITFAFFSSIHQVKFRTHILMRWLPRVAGIISVIFGVGLAIKIVFIDGLL